MAKVTIGGKQYETSALNFKALKQLWPQVSKLSLAGDSVDNGFAAVDLAVSVVSFSLIRNYPDMTVEFIEENMLASEIADIQIIMYEVLRESGLIKSGSPQGEVQSPPTEATSSTGTGTE